MNPDWIFPTQDDQLGAHATQVSTDTNFLVNQDAMNTTPWEGLSTSLTGPLSESAGTTDLGANPDLMWCGCAFPGIYCSQHHAYGGLYDGHLSPTSFGSGEGVAYHYDFFAQSEQIPELPQPSEANTVHTDQASQRPSEAPTKRLSRRSKISSTAKHILETYFSSNPYPDKEEVAQLNKKTGLNVKSIKTWFCNFRHRKARDRTIDSLLTLSSGVVEVSEDTKGNSCLVPLGPPSFPEPQAEEKRQRSRMASQSFMSISSAGIQRLDQVSPAHSTNSLERYLATPLEEDAVALAALELLPDIDIAAVERYSRLAQARNSVDWLQGRSDYHKAGSASSVNSGNSAGSWTSQSSINSRGSRRGRRNWARPSGGINKVTKTKKSTTTRNPKHTWYCTSPDCDKDFLYRYEWERHEAAVHHWPHVWTCNVDTDAPTVHKDATSRIFFRQDQFLAHLKSAHPGTDITQNPPGASKKKNPNFNRASLNCGFCLRTLRSWEERQDHIATHLQKGLAKSSWLRKEDVKRKENSVLAWANDESMREARSPHRHGIFFRGSRLVL